MPNNEQTDNTQIKDEGNETRFTYRSVSNKQVFRGEEENRNQTLKSESKIKLRCSNTAVETAIAQCTSRWAMARALTLPLFWRRSTVLSGLFRAVSAVELSLFRPLPTLSPSLISHLASVDVKQQMKKKNSEVSKQLPE